MEVFIMKDKLLERQIKFAAAILAAVIILFAPISVEARVRRQQQQPPPYRSSGVIPGTALSYERLAISNRGEVRITIVNPTNNGVTFTARFSFFNDRGAYLTSFTLEGFAPANRKIAHSLNLDDLNAYRRATMMRVLGRAGRMGREPDADYGAK